MVFCPSSIVGFAKDKTALTFLCDYLRMLTLGTDNPHEVEVLIDESFEGARMSVESVGPPPIARPRYQPIGLPLFCSSSHFCNGAK